MRGERITVFSPVSLSDLVASENGGDSGLEGRDRRYLFAIDFSSFGQVINFIDRSLLRKFVTR